jgi:hypothetical protein
MYGKDEENILVGNSEGRKHLGKLRVERSLTIK